MGLIDDFSDNVAQTITDYVYNADNEDWTDKVSNN